MMRSQGSILLLVLVFGSIFFGVLVSLSTFALIENRAEDTLIERAKTFAIAEAGLQYYGWFLSHFPTDFMNGTGHTGPYVIGYTDSSGAVVGSYTLSVAGVNGCGTVQSVDITSTGSVNHGSGITSTVVGRYGTPSVALYSTLVNDDSSPIKFSTIASDFPSLKAKAQLSGLYLPRHSSSSASHSGYHLIFNTDGTVSVKTVDGVATLHSVQPIDHSANFINDFTLIRTETDYTSLTVSSICGLIFVEDNTWIEGIIPNKVTVVVANTNGGGFTPEVVLHGNLIYESSSKTASLTIIAAHNILIAPDAPMNLTLDGVFIAQGGAFGRNNYYYPSGGCNGTYEPRGTLTILGTIVSNLPTSTLWPGGCGNGDAGYQTQTHAIDLENATSPAPFTPLISTKVQFVRWQQK